MAWVGDVIRALVWVVALAVMGLGAFDLVHAYSTPDVSAIQQCAAGIWAVGEAVIAYVVARGIDSVIPRSTNSV